MSNISGVISNGYSEIMRIINEANEDWGVLVISEFSERTAESPLRNSTMTVGIDRIEVYDYSMNKYLGFRNNEYFNSNGLKVKYCITYHVPPNYGSAGMRQLFSRTADALADSSVAVEEIVCDKIHYDSVRRSIYMNSYVTVRYLA